ncbi:hypothetical protein J3R83DRAFT_3568 [Lanmaoa asiatica]|nr:hypothetical protein J3R83DRAFT_3568 [Lanmaoa asiatica]
MDVPSSRPRLRLFRRSSSPRIPDDGPETTPQPASGSSSARLLFSAIHDEEDEFPTPRMHPIPIASLNPDTTPSSFPTPTSATPLPAETPAARLRALLAREPRSPTNTPPIPPPAPVSEADSAAESARFGSSTSSVTRESLRDIFSRALREPGDTPQKGRLRRNSFDGSSMDITPVVSRDRGQRRAARRSLSDEEAEKPKSSRQSDASFRLSTAVAFDTLRARLMSSQPQLTDQLPPVPLYDPSTSTSNSQHHPHASTSSSQFNSNRVTPPVNTITPHPSFQISSQLALQSNLLEQDSEMQRAMGDVLNSESEGMIAPASFLSPQFLTHGVASTSAPGVAQSTTTPSDSLRGGTNGSKLGHRRTSYEFHSIYSCTAHYMLTSLIKDREHRSQEEERNPQREREWNHPRLQSKSSTPEIHRRLSQEFRLPSHTKSFSHESVMSQSSGARPVHRHLERRGSLASLRSFDDDHSSRPSSSGSQADYRDRISELDRERNHEREREWNKRHPLSRPSSSLSASSNHSFSHSHTHPPRSPSATPYLTPTHASLQRKSSRTSLRSDSPASLASSCDSLKEREQEEKEEITHQRERNWNSPRPHWSGSKSPSTSHLKIRNKDNNTLRATSSLTHLGDSHGHRDASRVSTKLQSTSPKVESSATSSAVLHKSGDHHSGLGESADGTTQSAPLNGLSPGKTSGATSKFGWNFARSPLPSLELDDPADRRRSSSSPTPGSRPSSRASEAIMSSQIPVRSRAKSFLNAGHATSDMSLTHVVGDESSFGQDHQNGPSEVVESRSRVEPPRARNSWSQEDIVLGVLLSIFSPWICYDTTLASDEESIVELPPQSTTPKSNPPYPVPEEIETDTETEVLTSPSPQDSPRSEAPASIPNEAALQKVNDLPRSQTPNPSPDEPSVNATPPGTPPSTSTGSQLPTSEMSPSFALVTPPRQTSFSSSILGFRTPSPPHDLPDLPGPPSSSDDDALGGTPMKDRHVDANSNFTFTKTPNPPGAWAATPLPPKFGHRSSSPTAFFPLESTPPAFTPTPLPRANSHPHTRTETETDTPGEDGLLTPVGTLSRARSLPLRTPAPPGAWMATPGQSALLSNGVDQSQYGSVCRRKGLLKVRFDVAESETSATEGHPNSPISAIRLANPELPLPKLTTDRGTDNNIMNEVPEPTSTATVPHQPVAPERPTTPISRENGPSPRSLRKSPAVRLVDAYGRERVDKEGTAKPLIDLPNGHADAERKTTTSPPTPRRSLVRVVDAMGQEVEDAVEIPGASEGRANKSSEADVSIVSDDIPVGHAEALARMRKTLRDLAEGLSDTDRSEDLELNSSHLEQLEEVSKAARLARNQLAHNLHLETAKQHDPHHDSKPSAWTSGILPVTSTKKSWNTTIIYCGVIIQLLCVLAMWRYAHAEAHRLFYTTYYDPIYPEFTPIQGSSCFSGTLSTSLRSWTMFDSYETIRREGWWSIRKEILRAMRHIGDQAWERWGEHAHFEKPT